MAVLPAPYTHKFKVQLAGGGKFIEGLIEFNEDGKVSYRLDNTSQPMGNDVLHDFIDLSELLKRIFHTHGGIKLIKFADQDD